MFNLQDIRDRCFVFVRLKVLIIEILLILSMKLFTVQLYNTYFALFLFRFS